MQIDSQRFRCEDEEIFFFQCPKCSRVMAACPVCREVYPDPSNSQDSMPIHEDNLIAPIGVFTCPLPCLFDFDRALMDREAYRLATDDVVRLGLGSYLVSRDVESKPEQLPRVLYPSSAERLGDAEQSKNRK